MSDRTEQTEPHAPRMSVVIPTCNRCDILSRCLKALAAQTHDAFEVIVVDDGSTDATGDVLAAAGAAHSELALRWLRNDRHRGANPSRSRGVEVSRGALVAFADNDCMAQPDWLARLEAGFTSDRVAAVVGLVMDLEPTNVYELAFRGTHRVVGSSANRLVAGNMCVRRDVLRRFALDHDRSTHALNRDGSLDVTVSGRGDEEGLHLLLRAAGFVIRAAPDAVVVHEHGYTRQAFLRQACRGGRSAARLVYKYRLRPRLDLAPWMLAYLTLPLAVVDLRFLVITGVFLASGLAAITYNELTRKGKTISELLRSMHVLLLYYQIRLVGYVGESVRLRLRRHDVKRVDLAAAVSGKRWDQGND